jgi:hypothetical protein
MITSYRISEKPDMDFSVYYSKRNSEIYIDSRANEPFSIELFTISGAILYNGKMTGPRAIVPAGGFPSGIYIIKIRTERSSVSEKLILY